jgi:hypothetical protein
MFWCPAPARAGIQNNSKETAHMQFWTALIITFLGGPWDGETTALLYPSMDACLAAHISVSDGLGYDHQIRCEETDVLSSSIKPKPRPEALK